MIGCGGGSTSSEHAVTFGFNDDPNQRWFASQAELGMPARRLPVPWSEVEPDRGRWSWGRADASYAAMRAAGLRPLIVAIGAPCWARAPAPDCSVRSAGVPAPAFDPEWAGYARRLAARYPDALGIEVWNEPNLTALFPPVPDPQRFAALLAGAHTAIKAVDPGMPVISGGLLPIVSTGPRGMADADFLAAAYAAGAGASMDAIGAHPYPPAETLAAGASAADEVEAALGRLRSVRDAAGEENTPLWITEVGVSTAPAPGTIGVSEDAQADDLLDIVHALEADDDVPVVLIHRLVDVRAGPAADPLRVVESGFGVLRADGSPKPAACALSQELGGSLRC